MNLRNMLVSPIPRARRGIRWRRFLQENIPAYLYLLPALFVFAMYLWWPIVQAFLVAFQHVDLIHPPTWNGLDNFRKVLSDPVFFKAWGNALYYTILSLFFGYMAPVILAIALNEMRWKSFFRTAFYLPGILPGVVTALLWAYILAPGPDGLANSILRLLGLPPVPWLQSGRTAMGSFVLMSVWAGAGGAALMYLAALQGIPAHLYDAAEIDGANFWQRMIHVTLPQIRGVMLLFLAGQIIGTMQLFTEPYVVTGGGPANATVTPMLLLYRYAFDQFDFGAANAMGLITFFVLSGLSFWYVRIILRASQ
jgi:multiple sugar transport system permease protein